MAKSFSVQGEVGLTRMPKPPATQEPQGETVLSAVQEAVALDLRNYYQMQCVGPTPRRLQMLLDEVLRRVEAGRTTGRTD